MEEQTYAQAYALSWSGLRPAVRPVASAVRMRVSETRLLPPFVRACGVEVCLQGGALEAVRTIEHPMGKNDTYHKARLAPTFVPVSGVEVCLEGGAFRTVGTIENDMFETGSSVWRPPV
jgi:hypothetical protein